MQVAAPTAGERVVLTRDTRKAKREPAALDSSNAHRPVLWGGAVLTLASLTTYALLWWAPRFGVPQWEFSTISQSVEMMPLLVVGVTMMVGATIVSGRVLHARLLAAFCALLALVMVALGVVFLLASLVAWSQAVQAAVPSEAKWLLVRAVAKNLLLGGAFTGLYSAFAWSLWSRSRARRPAGGGGARD